MENSTIKIYKSGKFYNAFLDDAIILHFFLGYKYADYKKSVGFPSSAYNKVCNLLQKEKISYQVYEKDVLVDSFKGITNNYKKTLKNALKKLELEKRIIRIQERIEKFTPKQLEHFVEIIENDSL